MCQRNLAAVVYGDGSTPTVYDGNKIRSYNLYCNKKIASPHSETAKKVRKNIPYSRQMKRILKKVKPMLNVNSIKPGIAGLANPLRKCRQSGVLTFKSKPAGYDYSLAVSDKINTFL